MFLDEALITVAGGNGGHGAVSWRREKYVDKGGPDGGDGGRGGNVVLVADSNTDTLSGFASRKRFEAENGQGGAGRNKHGRNGEDLILKVPPGTQVEWRMENGEWRTIVDLAHEGDRIVIAEGGRGGYGNAHFTSSVRQKPDFAEKGEPGVKKEIRLELKLVADIGIIGYPSVGKSTLISVISAARPKIGDYDFTTLVPNLGVVTHDDRSFVVCDVPGLIEGASEGKGLGGQFLKHIERCGVLLHLLDASRGLGDPFNTDQLIADYKAIRKELEAHSPTLAAKKEIVALNKIDLIPDQVQDVTHTLHDAGIDVVLGMSAATKQNTDQLITLLLPIVLGERERRVEEPTPDEVPVLKPQDESSAMGAYRLDVQEDRITVRGKRLEQFTAMTNFESDGAVRRFRDVVERIGLGKALQHCRKSADMPVMIGEVRVDPYL